MGTDILILFAMGFVGSFLLYVTMIKVSFRMCDRRAKNRTKRTKRLGHRSPV